MRLVRQIDTSRQMEPENEQPDGQLDAPADSESGDHTPHEAVNLPALEALLFGTRHPLTAGRLAELLNLDSTRPIRAAIRALNQVYADSGRSFRIEQVAGGYQMLTLPQFGELLRALHQREADARLTRAAMETLAIIAYKQPILRAEIESIRGVACGETIRNLMEKHLVKIAGRAEEPGRPILYGTTRRFLELFGLNSLKDLPQPEGNHFPAAAHPEPELKLVESAISPTETAPPSEAGSQSDAGLSREATSPAEASSSAKATSLTESAPPAGTAPPAPARSPFPRP